MTIETLRLRKGLAFPRELSNIAPVAIITILQATVSLLLLRNTAFSDEALYIYAGRKIIESWAGMPADIDGYASYFSGHPFLYPVLAGAIDMIGGLEAARFASTLFMLCVTICTYKTTLRLFDRPAAVMASALFSCQAPVLFIGHFATFDALCLMLVAVSVTLAVKAATEKNPLHTLPIGPALLLSIGIKYVALLFAPCVLVIVALAALHYGGLKAAFVHTGLALLGFCAGMLAIVIATDTSFVSGMAFTTTQRTTMVPAHPAALVAHGLALGGILLGFAIAGVCLLRADRMRVFYTALLVMALLAPGYHVFKCEQAAFSKHLAFSLFFMAPLAGFAAKRLLLASRQDNKRWLFASLCFLCAFTNGITEARSQFDWTDTSAVIDLLRTQVHAQGEHYLADDYEVARYYFKDIAANEQWESTHYLDYDSTDGSQYTGNEAYERAVKEAYFDLIELNHGATEEFDSMITKAIRSSGAYELIASKPYPYANGTRYFEIWRKR